MKKSLSAVSLICLATVLASFNCHAFQRDSKAYFTMNLGAADNSLKRNYTIAAPYNFNTTAKGTNFSPVVMGELGYYLLDELRFSVAAIYSDTNLGKKKKQSTIATVNNVPVASKYSVNNTGVFANVTYDLLTDTALNPFISVGVGGLKTEIKDGFTFSGVTYNAMQSTTKAGYKFGGGVAYHMNTSMDFEVAYNVMGHFKKSKNAKYSDFAVPVPSTTQGGGPSPNTTPATGAASTNPKLMQILTLGIRYTF